VLARHASAVIRGQGAEYVMTEAMDAKRPVYEAAVTGKTSALFEMPVEGAALLAGRSKESAQQIAAIFRHMGILFQLQDDVLDLYGEKGRANPGGDLYEGKVSAFVVEYLDDSQNDSELLVQLLKTPRENISQREVDAMIVVFREKGVLDRVLSWLDSYAQSVRSNPSLEKEPALRELAETLLKVVLHPIEHVRAVV
ncbi:polyprenyl synthetase family protein, partial [Myxococcota bacterium]|nr:polyprenyl synthetase family protein [Myxococcota bacterium]